MAIKADDNIVEMRARTKGRSTFFMPEWGYEDKIYKRIKKQR